MARTKTRRTWRDDTHTLDATELRVGDFVWQVPVSDSYKVLAVRRARGRVVADVLRTLSRPETVEYAPGTSLRIVRTAD